ncbi:V-set domain-containing T-cell activation inhibitor 1-like isoform X2 [Cololabis saira]|uniref:V-set domain-containing T-cell activation inhibitor 1-like isoform X2 n=1 Tax=Cololabis saira TaxID=129043 RepID=UPI002AD4343D|nr:V-set domain-containing T-cell activation inhibitor 1-like isoform X2 [Cololabis saira]
MLRFQLQILLVFCLNSVSCQESVEGFVGGNVLLPCIYDQSLPAEVNAFWRDKDDLAVLDIKKSLPDYTFQDETYQGRVTSFPEEYKDGTFSILMTKLQKNDTGTYECYVKTGSYRRIVDLTVSDQPAGIKTDPPSGGAAGLKLLPLVQLSALCLLLCC